jgi:hypothetical protein
MRAQAAVLALVLLTLGCGEEAATKSADDEQTCKVVARDFRTCGGLGPTTGDRPHIDRRDGSGWREIAGPAEGKSVQGTWSGHWRSIHPSPDGRTLLLTWSAECEVPTAYFLPAEGGELRPAAGKVESVGLGWSKDGEAKVELLGGVCGHGTTKPGIYLVDPKTGKRKFVEGPLKGPMPLSSS